MKPMIRKDRLASHPITTSSAIVCAASTHFETPSVVTGSGPLHSPRVVHPPALYPLDPLAAYTLFGPQAIRLDPDLNPNPPPLAFVSRLDRLQQLTTSSALRSFTTKFTTVRSTSCLYASAPSPPSSSLTSVRGYEGSDMGIVRVSD